MSSSYLPKQGENSPSLIGYDLEKESFNAIKVDMTLSDTAIRRALLKRDTDRIRIIGTRGVCEDDCN